MTDDEINNARIAQAVAIQHRTDLYERACLAALTGLLACPYRSGSVAEFCNDAIKYANALVITIERAAGGEG